MLLDFGQALDQRTVKMVSAETTGVVVLSRSGQRWVRAALVGAVLGVTIGGAGHLTKARAASQSHYGSHAIVFVRGPVGGSKGDVFRMNADGTDAVRLTSTGHAFDPAWSPDGRQIAFDTGGKRSVIYVMVAQHVAAKHPERVRSLTLMMTSSGARGLPRPSAQVQRVLMASPADRSREAIVRHLEQLFALIGSPAYPTDPARLRQRMRSRVPEEYLDVAP